MVLGFKYLKGTCSLFSRFRNREKKGKKEAQRIVMRSAKYSFLVPQWQEDPYAAGMVEYWPFSLISCPDAETSVQLENTFKVIAGKCCNDNPNFCLHDSLMRFAAFYIQKYREPSWESETALSRAERNCGRNQYWWMSDIDPEVWKATEELENWGITDFRQFEDNMTYLANVVDFICFYYDARINHWDPQLPRPVFPVPPAELLRTQAKPREQRKVRIGDAGQGFEMENTATPNQNVEECPICFSANEFFYFSHCKHGVCERCLRNILSSALASKEKVKCPICRDHQDAYTTRVERWEWAGGHRPVKNEDYDDDCQEDELFYSYVDEKY